MTSKIKEPAPKAADPKNQLHYRLLSGDSQVAATYRILFLGRKLTQIDAIPLIGTTRLAARVADLREMGVPVKTEMICKNGKRYAAYYLPKEWRFGCTSV